MFKGLKNLCTPAYLYFLISAVALLGLLVQNLEGGSTYKLGDYQAEVGNVPMVFIGKVIYVLFWTVVLDALCKTGYKNLSWLLILFPFILFALAMVGLMMRPRIEGYTQNQNANMFMKQEMANEQERAREREREHEQQR